MTIKAYIKTGSRDIKANGKTKVYFRLKGKGKPAVLIGTEKEVKPEHWNTAAGMSNTKSEAAKGLDLCADRTN
jgi:hypothetical protein